MKHTEPGDEQLQQKLVLLFVCLLFFAHRLLRNFFEIFEVSLLYHLIDIRHLKGVVTTVKIKGAPSGLKQFLAIKSSLKMMKTAFYFILKALFVLEMFKFLS